MSEPVVVVLAVFVPSPGQRDATRSAIQSVLPDVHAEDGCLLYALHDAADGTLVLVEKWESERLLDAHGAAAPVARLGAALDGLIAGPPVVTRLTPVPAGEATKGRV